MNRKNLFRALTLIFVFSLAFVNLNAKTTFRGKCNSCNPPIYGTYIYDYDEKGNKSTTFVGDDSGKTVLTYPGHHTTLVGGSSGNDSSDIVDMSEFGYDVDSYDFTTTANDVTITTDSVVSDVFVRLVNLVEGTYLTEYLQVSNGSLSVSTYGLPVGCRYSLIVFNEVSGQMFCAGAYNFCK